MKELKKSDPKDLKMNQRLVIAFNWLRLNGDVKTAQELATKMQTSKTTVSTFLTNGRPVTDQFAYRFERMFLKKHNLTLEDFEKPHLLHQAQNAARVNLHEAVELLATKVVALEGGQELILDEIHKVQDQLGELLTLLKKTVK